MDAVWESAIRDGRIEDVRDLLRRGANIDARDGHGQTGLMVASHSGHREVVEEFIAHRASLNVTSKFGLSALMLSVIGGHLEVVRLLAGAGADLSLRGRGAPGFDGMTAYDLAVERGLHELYAVLKPGP